MHNLNLTKLSLFVAPWVWMFFVAGFLWTLLGLVIIGGGTALLSARNKSLSHV